VSVKIAALVMFLVSLAAGLAHAGEPQTLRENSWLCTTPEAYDQAVEEEWKRQGNGLQELKDQLLDAKLCMYVDHQYVAKMRVPVVTILGRQGGRVHVSFTAEWRKRLAVLHERITRIMYAGWTGAENLKDYEP